MASKSGTSSQDQKEKFLSKFEKLKESLDETQGLSALSKIKSSEEVWIVQCPKTINLYEFQDQKIKLPGKSHHNGIESIAEEYLQDRHRSLVYKSEGSYKITSVPIKGRVIFRQRLKNIKMENVTDKQYKEKTVPFPSNLKERHPLHGADYESRITLSENIVERLTNCEGGNRLVGRKIKREHPEETNSGNALLKIKKEKRKKKEISSIDASCGPSKQNRRKAQEDDLSWIKTI